MRSDNLHTPKYLFVYAMCIQHKFVNDLLLPGVSTLTVFSASCLALLVVSDNLNCAGLKNRP